MKINAISNTNFKGLFTDKSAQNGGNWKMEYSPYAWEAKYFKIDSKMANQENIDIFGTCLPDNEKIYTNENGKKSAKDILGTEFYYEYENGKVRKTITEVPAMNRENSLKVYNKKLDKFLKMKKDKSEEIKRALRQDEDYIKNDTFEPPKPRKIGEPRDIQIDVNHPESLPVPKLLRSFVVYDGGLITSSEAFDKLANDVHKEIMLEIPSLNDLSDRFLSHVPTVYSRVIINDFDVSDMSYMILVSSLLKQGVQIKTVPQVHSINLITDDSNAMIISKGSNNSDVEYGAIYEDRKSISEIRTSFEKTWDIAANLDENLVANYIQ